MGTILDLEIKQLVSHGDERGFFREIIRSSDSLFANGKFGQWSHSRMVKDTVKAWHFHHLQYDWWYVPFGRVKSVFIDNRPESPTYREKIEVIMGNIPLNPEERTEVCVRIPPGVLHGCRVYSEEAHLFYITSETYNPQDEGRLPYNSSEVDHEWGEGAIVVENDKRLFIPPHARVQLNSPDER